MDKYVQHIKGSENKSLLSRVYGLYRIKQKKGQPVDLIVLQNLNKAAAQEKFKYQFILTGASGKDAQKSAEFDLA